MPLSRAFIRSPTFNHCVILRRMKQASYAFSAEDYKESKKEYERDWQTLDQVLYSLCREHPHHKDKGAVNASQHYRPILRNRH